MGNARAVGFCIVVPFTVAEGAMDRVTFWATARQASPNTDDTVVAFILLSKGDRMPKDGKLTERN
jgi:hypothetical protein